MIFKAGCSLTRVLFHYRFPCTSKTCTSKTNVTLVLFGVSAVHRFHPIQHCFQVNRRNLTRVTKHRACSGRPLVGLHNEISWLREWTEWRNSMYTSLVDLRHNQIKRSCWFLFPVIWSLLVREFCESWVNQKGKSRTRRKDPAASWTCKASRTCIALYVHSILRYSKVQHSKQPSVSFRIVQSLNRLINPSLILLRKLRVCLLPILRA